MKTLTETIVVKLFREKPQISSERSGTRNLQQPHFPGEESVGVSVRTVVLYRRATDFALVLALLPPVVWIVPGNN